jgi:hypothetical protein
VWQGLVDSREIFKVPHLSFEIPPGRSVLRISSDAPGTAPGPGDSRLLAFAIYDLAWMAEVAAPDPASAQISKSQSGIHSSFPADYWYGLEHDAHTSWRWANGSARIVVHNSGNARRCAVSGALASFGPDRKITLRDAKGKFSWQGDINAREQTQFEFECIIPTGDSELLIDTGGKPVSPGGGDARVLAIALFDFQIEAVNAR